LGERRPKLRGLVPNTPLGDPQPDESEAGLSCGQRIGRARASLLSFQQSKDRHKQSVVTGKKVVVVVDIITGKKVGMRLTLKDFLSAVSKVASVQ
jgi:hypothetical protein